MRLARVFGISPEYAAQLEKASVRTALDLVEVADLAALSVRSQTPLTMLEQWRTSAKAMVTNSRRRRKAVRSRCGHLGFAWFDWRLVP